MVANELQATLPTGLKFCRKVKTWFRIGSQVTSFSIEVALSTTFSKFSITESILGWKKPECHLAQFPDQHMGNFKVTRALKISKGEDSPPSLINQCHCELFFPSTKLKCPLLQLVIIAVFPLLCQRITDKSLALSSLYSPYTTDCNPRLYIRVHNFYRKLHNSPAIYK